jgi:hypothetical protein
MLESHPKLSKLQKWMLKEAFYNVTQENRALDHKDGADLYAREILGGYFKFPIKWKQEGRTQRELLRDIDAERTVHRESTGMWIASYALNRMFEPERIGRQKYNAACASIYRTFNRLEKRGLVEVWISRGDTFPWTGVRLTAEGRKVAQLL